MKRLILLVVTLLFIFHDAESHSTDLVETIGRCFMTSLQGDLPTELQRATFAFDNNFTLFFINSGINYNSNNTTTLYVGIGLGSLIQIQYGKPLDIKENLIRVRLDWPLLFHFHKDKNSIFNYTYIGIYYINSDKKINFNENYGITFSMNVNRAISKLNED